MYNGYLQKRQKTEDKALSNSTNHYTSAGFIDQKSSYAFYINAT
jgi:hypothetical protein